MPPSPPSSSSTTTTEITKLYAFGSNGSGQLGVGHTDDLSVPERCIFQDTDSDGGEDTILNHNGDGSGSRGIEKVVAGGNHTLILTGSGNVYAAGDDSDGRCYAGNKGGSQSSTFRRLKWKSDDDGDDDGVVTDVAATWEASFLVLNRRKIYVFGSGSKGELGAGKDVLTTATRKLIFDVTDSMTEGAEGSTISGIYGGMNHVLVTLEDGSLYGWGSCRKGQLGSALASTQRICWKVTKLDMPFKVERAACGRDFTIVQGENGQCSILGDQKKVSTMSLFQPHLDGQIQSGWSCVYSLRKGKLQVTGRNDRGQFPPVDQPTLTSFAAGSEHAIAHTSDGFVVAWGWGEHGNCGTSVDARGCVVGRCNLIDLKLGNKESILGVGAGCATSFVWTIWDG